jgi:hypothetical protein
MPLRNSMFFLCFGAVWLVPISSGIPSESSLSQRQLIAAMPPETESVLAIDHDVLLGSMSAFRKVAGHACFHPSPWLCDVAPEWDLRCMVERAIIRTQPRLHVLGGKKFAPPVSSDAGDSGLGAGNFVDVSIWQVRRPLIDLRDWLDELASCGKRVRRSEVLGTTVYASHTLLLTSDRAPPRREERFLAFPDETTVVLTEEETALRHILHSLSRKNFEIPPQWACAASRVSLEAPIIILRSYRRAELLKDCGKVGLPEQTDERDSMAIVVADITQLAMQFQVCTPDVDCWLQVWDCPGPSPPKRWEDGNGFELKFPLHLDDVGEFDAGAFYSWLYILFGMRPVL